MNIVSAWIKQSDQNVALMPGADATEFNLAVWNKTDKHQKWQWNSKDSSLHAWIDVSTYEPSIKFANSYCSNQGSIPPSERADNLTPTGPNGGETKWHTVASCNQLCHTKTWCTEFTHWKKDNKGLCRLYGSECQRSATDAKWDHYNRSTARPKQTEVSCPAEPAYFIEDKGQAITWAEAKQWVETQPNGRLPTAAEVQKIIATNSGQSKYEDAAFRTAPLAFRGHLIHESSGANEGVFGAGGRDYRGNQTKTKSGKTCQDWGSHNVHEHYNNVEAKKPDAGIEAGHNKCRNPDGEDSIWCYTTDPATRWELCDPIPTTGSWTPTLEGDGTKSYVEIGPLHGPPIPASASAPSPTEPQLLHENSYIEPSRYSTRIADGGYVTNSSVSACNALCNAHADCVEFGIWQNGTNRCDMWTTTEGGYDQAYAFNIYKPSKSLRANPSRAEQSIVNSATNAGPCSCNDHPRNYLGNHKTSSEADCISACYNDSKCMMANLDKTYSNCHKYSKVCECNNNNTQNKWIMDYAPAESGAPGKWYPGVDLVKTIGNMPSWGTDRSDSGKWHTAVLWMQDCIPRSAYTPPPPISYMVTYDKKNKHFTNSNTKKSIVADLSDKNEATKAHIKASPHDNDKASRWDTVPCGDQ